MPTTARALVLATLSLVLALLGPASASLATASAEPRKASPARAAADPLKIHLDSIKPSALSDDERPVRITGTLTNQSDEQWTDINLYALVSASPIVDAPSLAASSAIDADEFVGERIVTPGTEDTVEVLEPGETTEFRLKVPRSEILVEATGVYWLGVHALGSSSVERDIVADGRARTFIPLVPRSGKNPDSVDAAIVVPVRETVWLTPSGRVDRVGRWARSLAEGGRLHSILTAGDADVPLTWLVDPAVLAAVARLEEGNPDRSLAPDPAVTPEPTEEPSDEPASPTDGAPAGPDPFSAPSDPIPPVDPDDELTEEEQRVAGLAGAWLDRFRQVTADQPVLALPYGDLDVSAAAVHGPGYYQQAVTRSAQVMAWLEVAATPAIAPRDGILSPAAIEAATPDTTIMVADTSFASVPPNAPQSMVRLLEHKVVVTSSGAAAGGPSPTAFADPLALRQRLLSEVALRLQSGSRSPVVMMLPAHWRPVDPSPLFTGLEVPWLEPISVADLTLRPAASMNAVGLVYTDEDAEAALDVRNFSAADQFTTRANLLAGTLSLPNLVRQQVADEVLMSLSSGHRVNAARAAESVREASVFVADQMASVTVDAPDAVTLSSESGQFGADLVNGLDQPVTVRIAVESDGDLEFADQGPIQISAGARHRILPRVTADRPGIHQVRLVVTDTQGEPLGSSTNLQIRAAQVSGLIWLLLAGGAALLFGTIAVRLVRRLRDRGKAGDKAAGEQVA